MTTQQERGRINWPVPKSSPFEAYKGTARMDLYMDKYQSTTPQDPKTSEQTPATPWETRRSIALKTEESRIQRVKQGLIAVFRRNS